MVQGCVQRDNYITACNLQGGLFFHLKDTPTSIGKMEFTQEKYRCHHVRHRQLIDAQLQ